MAEDPANPGSYDAIVRRTVPELDTSMRPTKEQEAQALAGFRAMDDAEKILYAQVSDALIGAVAMGSVQVEVTRKDVTLSGNVPDVASIDRVESLVRDIDGIGQITNRLVVPART